MATLKGIGCCLLVALTGVTVIGAGTVTGAGVGANAHQDYALLFSAIHTHGTTFRDSANRTRLFHGANYVMKGGNHLPNITDGDIETLLSIGANVARLGVMLDGMFPTPDRVPDAAYLPAVKEIRVTDGCGVGKPLRIARSSTYWWPINDPKAFVFAAIARSLPPNVQLCCFSFDTSSFASFDRFTLPRCRNTRRNQKRSLGGQPQQTLAIAACLTSTHRSQNI